MDSKQVKQAFKQAGISVRVADQGAKFRICTTSGVAFDKEGATDVAMSIGLTDVLGLPGGQFNQGHEMIGYKPGSVRRI